MTARKKRTPPTLFDDLVSYEIFPRLPAKSIHRLRCVSTSCRRLTSNPQFLSAVRRLSVRRYHLSFSVFHPQELALYSLDQSGAASSVTVAGKPLIHANTVNGLTLTVQAGNKFSVTHADGYIGVAQEPYIATVSNPATNETFQLPPVRPALRSVHHRMCFYFCHDPTNDTYKVLRTAVAYNDPTVTTTCSIFTLGAKTTSTWRDIDLLRLKQLGNSKSVCIDGTLYSTRFCLDNINNKAVICAFTVETERFYPVGYPPGLSPSRYEKCHLIELKGALAVIDVVGEEIKLWVKEKGRVEAWTETRIGFDPRWEMSFRLLMKSCSFSTNYEGEIVMGVAGWRSEEGCWIFTYNVDKGEWTRSVEVKGLGDHYVTGDLRVEENVTNILSLTQTLNPSSRSSTCTLRP